MTVHLTGSSGFASRVRDARAGVPLPLLPVLASLALSQLHSACRPWFTAFAGTDTLQTSLTGICPLALVLHRPGARTGTSPSRPAVCH